MSPNELVKMGSNFLKKNNIKTHLLDSELILSSISGQTRENFLVDNNQKLTTAQIKSYNSMILRRGLAKEPIAYLLNEN